MFSSHNLQTYSLLMNGHLQCSFVKSLFLTSLNVKKEGITISINGPNVSLDWLHWLWACFDSQVVYTIAINCCFSFPNIWGLIQQGACEKSQWLGVRRCFSLGTLIFSTNKDWLVRIWPQSIWQKSDYFFQSSLLLTYLSLIFFL